MRIHASGCALVRHAGAASRRTWHQIGHMRPASIGKEMATSLYKGQRLGGLPPCLICAGPGEGPRAQLYLTHGVSVWLCAAHRSPGFLRRRAGRDFFASLHALWQAAGCLGARRTRALQDHLRRVHQAASEARPRPGSYAWPHLRREAERRFAAGQAPRAVIGEIRARHNDGPAPGPSLRTLRRWFNEGRWLGYLVSRLATAARPPAVPPAATAAGSPAPAPTPPPPAPPHSETGAGGDAGRRAPPLGSRQ
jgi:hypothetical protein